MTRSASGSFHSGRRHQCGASTRNLEQTITLTLEQQAPSPRQTRETICARRRPFRSFIIIIVVVIFKPTSTTVGMSTRLDIQNYGCNGNLLCDHGVVERNRISSLWSHGKALEKECCLMGVFCDSGDTPANLLCELNGHLMPCTSCLYGKWVEDVLCAGQFGVFAYLVLCY